MIEVYGKGGEEEQPEQPKHVAMVGLKGGLSRKQGTKVESEEKTEEHNKRVVTVRGQPLHAAPMHNLYYDDM